MSRPETNDRPRVPGLVDEPVFAEPWQAQAFAMVVALHERGLFTWDEWARALSAEVKSPKAAADGSDYYEHWLKALEKLLTAKGVAGAVEIDALSKAWQRAAHATPHGKPILLENDPERAGSCSFLVRQAAGPTAPSYRIRKSNFVRFSNS